MSVLIGFVARDHTGLMVKVGMKREYVLLIDHLELIVVLRGLEMAIEEG